MANPQAVRLFEQIYARVDQQVRDIVTSMLPAVNVAAQDDGTVIANDHRILNFQGDGVSIQDDTTHRRVNVLIPGSPVATSSRIVQSSDASGKKCISLWGYGTSHAISASLTTGLSGCVSGDESGRVVYDSGPISDVTTINVSVSATVNGSASDYGFYWRWWDGSSWHTSLDQQNFSFGSAHTWSVSYAADSRQQFQLMAYARGVGCTTATLNITVSGTWGAANNNSAPPANWTTVGFSDTSWSAPVTVATGGAGNAYLWPASVPVAATEEALFRQTFTLPSGTQVASASLTVNWNDDLVGIWLNNSLIRSQNGTGTLTSITVNPSLLVVGTNVLACHIRNTSGAASAGDAYTNYKLTLTTTVSGTDTQYQLVSQKDQASGYAGLTAGALVPTAELGSGTADATTFLRGDRTWAAGGGGGMTNPMTTQDDIIVGGSSGTPARLAKGSNGQVLTVDSGTGHVAWNTPSAGGTALLATRAYAAGSDGSVTTTSTSFVDVDATNQAVTFTAPASGQVLVRVTGGFSSSNATNSVYFGLRESTTNLSNTSRNHSSAVGTVQPQTALAFLVSGLTPSSSHTYKLAFRTGNAGTAAQVWTGPTYGQTIYEVWSA